MFDDVTYKYFTAVLVMIGIIYLMYTCYKPARIEEKRKNTHVSSASCKLFFQLSLLIVIERDILIILRKSSVSVRFISMALALLPKTISCTYNDDQTEINFQFKKKSQNRI